jgi:hypothetical protein
VTNLSKVSDADLALRIDKLEAKLAEARAEQASRVVPLESLAEKLNRPEYWLHVGAFGESTRTEQRPEGCPALAAIKLGSTEYTVTFAKAEGLDTVTKPWPPPGRFKNDWALVGVIGDSAYWQRPRRDPSPVEVLRQMERQKEAMGG